MKVESVTKFRQLDSFVTEAQLCRAVIDRLQDGLVAVAIDVRQCEHRRSVEHLQH